MTPRSSLLPASLFVGCLALLLGWAEWTNWQQITRLRQRLGAVELESDAAEFQTRLLSLHGKLLNALLHPAADHEQPGFTAESGQLAAWLHTQETDLAKNGNAAEIELLGKISALYTDYRAAAGNLPGSESPRQPLEKNATGQIGAIGAALAPLLLEVEKWKRLHHVALSSDIAGVEHSLGILHVLLLGSFCLLVTLAAILSWLIHRGLIAPLRRELVATHALIARQEKLASLGVLAAGVAHEIRNPLTAIKARLFSQQRKLAADSPEHADAQVISGEINRLERIVREVLLFARPDDPTLEACSAAAFLHEIGDFLTPSLEKNRIALHVAAEEDFSIQVDPAQMRQVFINLVQNAADSISEGGTITLRVRSAVLPLASQRTQAAALEVEDTGPGIPPEVQARLFDPFFTTKASGTGLGLAIAARITQKHGGLLQYHTQSGRGTTFSVVLPLA